MRNALVLSKIGEVLVAPTLPFDFISTVYKPSHFHSQLVSFSENKLYQTIKYDGRTIGLIISEVENSVKKEVKVEVFGRDNNVGALDFLADEISWRYNLTGELSEFVTKFKKDRLLSKPLKRFAGMRPSCAYSLYEFLVVAVMLQNATVKRTINMLDVMLKQYGQTVEFGGKELIAMWEPQSIVNVPEEELRALKIGYRAKNILKISEAFATDLIDENELRGESKESILKVLTAIYGIGPQTASYMLFEYFHFYDAFDRLSPWEGKIFSMLIAGKKDTPTVEITDLLKEKYGKWRALAAHYIFEDLFWQRKEKLMPWLEEEIRD